MISRLLVANRGEIARRVFATCRRLGIETVAVHSPADSGLPFVAEADYAVVLPGDTPSESYLRIDAILDAAGAAGADAVHPGYGFLAENADFARAVLDAGLTWVGPTPESIEAMGDKVRAKALMVEAGVPVLDSLDPEAIGEADLPVLVKASAGGGGRGMRVVRTLAELPTELAAAQAEATSAFGDGTVFVEPYVERGRHIEIQVFGDGNANISILGSRDCSIQRRHQKVVEEAPAPDLDPATEEAMFAAARTAAEAIRYRGAGTVEFLFDVETARFFFLEMNTRLQVEHPVTEATTGVDLVELQVAAAEGGRALAIDAEPAGHAVEVRLYAEDPAAAYQPQSGGLVGLEFPDAVAEFGPLARAGIRVDAGYRTGDEVSTHYDAMLAKVVSWAPGRDQAIRQLSGALRRARIHGVTTNRDQLLAVLADERFLAGDVSTAFLDDLPMPETEVDPVALMTAAAVHVGEVARRRTVQRGVPVGWRNVSSQPHETILAVDGAERVVRWWGWPEMDFPELDGRATSLAPDGAGWRVAVEHAGRTVHTGGLIAPGTGAAPRGVYVDLPHRSVLVHVLPRFADPATQHASGTLLAPMPGTVVAVPVAVGDRVTAGQPVLVLEAMKMQHTVAAPEDGVVTEMDVTTGDQVAAGDVLAVVQGDEQE